MGNGQVKNNKTKYKIAALTAAFVVALGGAGVCWIAIQRDRSLSGIPWWTTYRHSSACWQQWNNRRAGNEGTWCIEFMGSGARSNFKR